MGFGDKLFYLFECLYIVYTDDKLITFPKKQGRNSCWPKNRSYAPGRWARFSASVCSPLFLILYSWITTRAKLLLAYIKELLSLSYRWLSFYLYKHNFIFSDSLKETLVSCNIHFFSGLRNVGYGECIAPMYRRQQEFFMKILDSKYSF